jgi:hypothetical protein
MDIESRQAESTARNTFCKARGEMSWTYCAQREVLRMPFTMLALDSIEEIEGRADTRSNPQVGVMCRFSFEV